MLNRDIDNIQLKCQEIAGLLANSMNQMPNLQIGHLAYRSESISLIVLDDCFQYILQDGLLTFHPSKQREIHSKVCEAETQRTSFHMFVLVILL